MSCKSHPGCLLVLVAGYSHHQWLSTKVAASLLCKLSESLPNDGMDCGPKMLAAMCPCPPGTDLQKSPWACYFRGIQKLHALLCLCLIGNTCMSSVGKADSSFCLWKLKASACLTWIWLWSPLHACFLPVKCRAPFDTLFCSYSRSVANDCQALGSWSVRCLCREWDE